MNNLVVIPAYNERENIAGTVTGALRHIPDVLVVDDHSDDDTATLAARAGAAVVRHPFNLGPAAAYQTGYKYALAHGYDSVVQLDGDGQHDPNDIPKLMALLAEGVDLAIGSRFHGLGSYRMPRMRKMGKTYFTWLIRLLTGRIILDPTSGFRAFSRPLLEFFASDAFADEYPDADMLILVLRRGFRIAETGVSMRPSNTGRSIHAGLLRPVYYMTRMSLGVFSAMLAKNRRTP